MGGNLLPGYDMVSDAAVANDDDGRDGDASDPGDWVTQAEIAQRGGEFFRCADSPEPSSWHGTQVSGLIAAVTHNGIGMASTAPGVRVLPVRVLGKCGGHDSDILAGMRWAAGLSVPGVPANPYPARVINLSLGGDGAVLRRVSGRGRPDHRRRYRDRGGGRQHVRPRGRHAGQLPRRDRRGRASPRRHQGRLLLAGSRGGDQRARGQLRQYRAPTRRACTRSSPPPIRAPPCRPPRRIPTASTSRSERASRRPSWPASPLSPCPSHPHPDARSGEGAAPTHGAAVPRAGQHRLQQRGPGVHSAAIHPHRPAGRPARVLLHHHDLRRRHAGCRGRPGGGGGEQEEMTRRGPGVLDACRAETCGDPRVRLRRLRTDGAHAGRGRRDHRERPRPRLPEPPRQSATLDGATDVPGRSRATPNLLLCAPSLTEKRGMEDEATAMPRRTRGAR